MRVLLESEWEEDGYYDPIAYLEMPVEEIATKNGFEVIDLPGDWPGRVVGQFLKDNAGNQYYLLQTTDGPSAEWNERTAIYVPMMDRSRAEYSTVSLTNSFLNAINDLNLPPEKVMHLHKNVDAERANGILGMRMDPHVERFSLEFKG